MNKYILFFLVGILLSACSRKSDQHNNSDNRSSTTNQTDSISTNSNTLSKNEDNEERDTVFINCEEHEVILDILTQLPDNCFGSFEWNKKDRKKAVSLIKEHDYYIPPDMYFLTLLEINPHSLKFGVIDGSFELSIYKTNHRSYIAVTDDRVADGHFINIYEYKNGIVKPFKKPKDVFGDIVKTLTTKNCSSNINDQALFNYHLGNSDRIEIEDAWNLSKNKYWNCLKGNAIIYKFNPATKKFDVEKIYWKQKRV